MCIKKCVICGKLLDESNKSIEHIIPNAICGHLDSNKIYCKNCNNKFGDKLDKEFTKIFTAIVSQLNTNKSRKTKGTSYKGVICDTNNNKYLATFKNNKLIEYRDFNKKYIGNNKIDFKTLYYNFELDNNAFKKGFAKIAFNYAIDIGLEPYELEKVFDNNRKQFLEDLIIIPFYPLTLFDKLMETQPIQNLYHVVRIFNIKNYLYAYVELFNTFQHYVLLSEKFDYINKKELDQFRANLIEKHKNINEEDMNSLIPKNIEEALIFAKDYGIDLDNLQKTKHHQNLKELFKDIGRQAFEIIRKEPYEKNYIDLLNNNYKSFRLFNYISITDKESLLELAFNHNFYIKRFDYNEDDNKNYSNNNNSNNDELIKYDSINIETYKKYLPNTFPYPITTCGFLKSNSNFEKIKLYCHYKFQTLEKYISLTCKSNT